MGCITAPRYST
jgi:hypothetical protein